MRHTVRGRKAAIALAVALVAGTGAVATAGAAPAGPPALRSPEHGVHWSGAVDATAAPPGGVPECEAVACDSFTVELALPPGLRAQQAAAVEFAVRWASVFDTLGLYVYRGSSLVAGAGAPFATAQAVHVPLADAPDGTYTVHVAYDPDRSSSQVVPYDGLVEIERSPGARPARRLLPDLAARPQRNVTFETPLPFFEEPVEGESCLPSEAEEEAAELCLRFDQVLANVGEGPLELRFVLPKDPGSTDRGIYQRIRWSDDPAHVEDLLAGESEFHEAHDHFHFTGFALSRLWAADAHGRRVGSEPVRTGDKVSFCLVDIEVDGWGEPNGPRTFAFPNCLEPSESDATNDYLVQGITPGWADVYDWFLPDQYIEVSGLADGRYVLDTIVDPDGLLVEADERNNCGAVVVELSGMATASPSASIVGPGPRC